MPSASRSHAARRLPLYAGVLLLWQLLFWPLVHWAERAARPAAMANAAQVEVQALDAGRQLIATLSAQRSGLDGYVLEAPAQAALLVFRVPFAVDDPARPLALYLAIREQVREIRLNGTLLQASVPLARLEGLLTSEPSYYALPAASVRQGGNLLEIEKEVSGYDMALSEYAIDGADTLAQSYRWRTLLLTDLALIGVGVLLFTIALCLAVNWPSEDRPRIRALILLLASQALGTYFLSFSPPFPMSLPLFVCVWIGINVAMAVAIAQYALLDVGVSPAIARRVHWTWPLAALLLVATYLGARWQPERADALLTEVMHAAYWLALLVGAAAVAMLALALVRERGRRFIERSVLALCWSAFVLDRVGSLYDLHSPFDAALPLTLPWSPIVGTLLGLSMVFALAREAAQARRTVLRANDLLAAELKVREAQLEQSYAERNEMLRVAAIQDERQRIVRDMHDGIGGQLVGLKMQVHARQLDAAALESALDDSIHDLRLIVDSLDTAEDGLGMALIAFERRIRSQVQAAGLRFESDQQMRGAPDRLGARATLNVLRTLQEAVTNVLRHAQASSLRLECHWEPAPGQLRLAVIDDGRGIAADAMRGKGQAHMQQRARAVGGELRIDSRPGRTAVTLTVPLPA
ncbi:MAG: histidine kinase [Lysobacterales bacterium]